VHFVKFSLFRDCQSAVSLLDDEDDDDGSVGSGSDDD